MLQQVIIVGNLGGNPEMRYTPDGKAVTNFSMATNRKWKNADGGAVEEVTWWRVSAWGRLAEVTNEYLTKGRQVLVVGRMRPDPETGGPRVYEKRDGSMGASFELTARSVKFLGGRSGGGGDAPEDPEPSGEEGGGSNPIPF